MDQAQPVSREGIIGNSKISIGRFTYGVQYNDVRHPWRGTSLTIGAFCSISNCTIFLGGEHDYEHVSNYPFEEPRFRAELGGGDLVPYAGTNGGVTIGNDVWIGYGSTIMSGITVGDGAVIAANAHVVRDVEPYSIVGGNPARHLKFRFDKETIDLLLRLEWWNLPTPMIKEISKILYAKPDREVLLDLLKTWRS